MKKFTHLSILALLLMAATGAKAQNYYTPSDDEVIILNEVYSASASGYSTHSAIAWGGAVNNTSDKKAGDPNNDGNSTSSKVPCYTVKGTGKDKNITLSITGVSKIIIYHESNSSRYIELRLGDKKGDIIASGSTSSYYTEVELAANTQYSIFLHGTNGSSDQDFYVYAIKLIKGGSTPLALADSEDNSTALSDANGKVYDVTLGRTLQAGGWNTFAVPFAAAIPTGWTVKKLASSELTGDLLTLNFENATSIAAGTPYLVKVETNVENPTFESVTVSSASNTVSTEYADFVPAVNKTDIVASENVLFIADGNTLTYPTADGTLSGFRAYFQLKSAASARTFQMMFDGETTGIKTIGNASVTTDSSAVYDLQGRRVENPTHGLYIVNGKKVMVK